MGECITWCCDIKSIKLLKPVHRFSTAHYLDKIREVFSPHIDLKAQDEWNNNRELIIWHTYFSIFFLPRPASSSERNLQTTCERIPVFWNKTAFQSAKKLFFFACEGTEEEENKLLQKFGNYLPIDTVSYPARPAPSSSLLWEPQISQIREDFLHFPSSYTGRDLLVLFWFQVFLIRISGAFPANSPAEDGRQRGVNRAVRYRPGDCVRRWSLGSI